MSEKGTPFINILAALIFHSAKEKGVADDTVGGLTAAHQLNTAGGKHQPFAVMKPKIRNLVEHEVDGVDTAVENLGVKNIGHVKLKSTTAGPAVQALAARVDYHVSERKRRNDPVAKAKRIVQEIEDEIIKKNNW